MKKTAFLFVAAMAWLVPTPAAAQTALNVNPSRSLGQAKFELNPRTANPNLVEGREFYLPWYVAVDRSSTPNALYVSDAGNNRVLGWRNANQYANGSPADIVIGQVDRQTTFAAGPGTTRTTGLSLPGALAVDNNGNLYVVDSNNNRILRFPKPFNQQDDLKQPDMVIGQPNFNVNPANNGGLSEKSIYTSSAGGAPVTNGLTFDASGNLYFADAQNNRVLRYPANALASGQNNIAADLVLGQPIFGVNAGADAAGRITNKTGMRSPSGLAIDAQGRLYVCDGLSRVMVFTPPFINGQAAARLMGIGQILPGNAVAPTTSEYTLLAPEAVFFINNQPYVVDSVNNRILRYDAYDLWPAETPTPAPAGSTITISPPAKAVIGQVDFTQNKANKGLATPSESTLNQPLSATFANGDIIVADSGNNRVLNFPQTNVSGIGTGANRVLGQPTFDTNAPNLIEGREFFLNGGTNIGGGLSDGAGIVIDKTSNPPHLYIADTFNNRILGFRDARAVRSPDKADIVIGQPDFLHSVVNYPSGDPDQMSDQGLYHPAGVAVDAAGNLYVADSGNGRVLRFPTPFAQTGSLRPNLVLGQAGFSGVKLQQPTATTMSFPYGMAFLSNGALLVSDSVNHRVILFQKQASGDFTSGQRASKAFGQFDLLTGSLGTGDKRFNSPRGIATDTDDRLYVMDSGNNRMAIYDNVLISTQVDPAPALSIGGFNSPQGIFVSSATGEIWVADSRNNRVLRFPRYDKLTFSSAADYALNSGGPLGVTQDAFGNVFVAEGLNRVTMFYNALSAKNSASYNDQRVISPGMITSLFSLSPGVVKFSDATVSTPGLPLPTTLGDTQVLVNDTPAPLYFVSQSQINFVVPNAVKDSATAEVQVIKPSTGQLIATFTFSVYPVSPALYTVNGTGSGQLAATNPDGTVNSPTNRVARNQYITLYGTGAGFISGAPPDGQAASGPVKTDVLPRVLIGADFVADSDIQYSGLAPGFPGLWQINVKVPDLTVPAEQVPVGVIMQSVQSTRGEGGRVLSTWISVKQ